MKEVSVAVILCWALTLPTMTFGGKRIGLKECPRAVYCGQWEGSGFAPGRQYHCAGTRNLEMEQFTFVECGRGPCRNPLTRRYLPGFRITPLVRTIRQRVRNGGLMSLDVTVGCYCKNIRRQRPQGICRY